MKEFLDLFMFRVPKYVKIKVKKGLFTNYVDMFSAFFDHPSLHGSPVYLLGNVDISGTPLPLTVNVVCECPQSNVNQSVTSNTHLSFFEGKSCTLYKIQGLYIPHSTLCVFSTKICYDIYVLSNFLYPKGFNTK